MHHVGIEQAHQTAEDDTTLPKHCNKNTQTFVGCLLIVREKYLTVVAALERHAVQCLHCVKLTQ